MSVLFQRLMAIGFAISLLLNLAMIVYLAQSGGLRRILIRLDLVEHSEPRQQFQKDIEARYDKFPHTPAGIIFAGDSLIASGHWAEFYGEIHNRGVGGETTSGFLDRLDTIIESKPRKIFLLMGTNDLAKGVPVAQFVRNYRSILERIRKESPDTVLRVIGILPINPEAPGELVQNNAQVAEANVELKKLVAEFAGVEFVDISGPLLDESGRPRNEYYLDKVHLSVDGFLAIRQSLAPYMAPGDRPGATPLVDARP